MTTLTRQVNTNNEPTKSPQSYRHAVWLFIVPLSLILFAIVEKHVAIGKYNVMHLPFDDKIPFIPAFIIPYSLWYPMLIAIGIHHFFRDPAAFRRYIWSYGITYAVSMIIFVIFPNGQNMRPDLRSASGILVQTIAYLHSIDTNTNVFPSIHIIGSLLIIFAVFDSTTTRRLRYIIPALVFLVLTAAATVCLKQHSITDIYGGLIVGLFIYLIVYVLIKKIQFLRRNCIVHRTNKSVNYRNR